jgi:hypothetical protein
MTTIQFSKRQLNIKILMINNNYVYFILKVKIICVVNY